jgi:hypothetical protein
VAVLTIGFGVAYTVFRTTHRWRLWRAERSDTGAWYGRRRRPRLPCCRAAEKVVPVSAVRSMIYYVVLLAPSLR